MSITIDILSLSLGIIFGAAIMTTLTFTVLFKSEQWDAGFGYGWKCGEKHAKEKMRKEVEDTDNDSE